MSKARRRRYFVRWVRYERRCRAAVTDWERSMVPPAGIERVVDRLWADLLSSESLRVGRIWEP